MLIDILNVDEFMKINGFLEVKCSNYWIPNTSEPHPEGLISNEIFGEAGTPDRKFKWGYIELNDVFMNPHVYYVFTRIHRMIADNIKNGLGRYFINAKGDIEKLPKGQTVPKSALSEEGTGFKWLYKNWKKITWRTTSEMGRTAKDRREFMKSLKIDEVFITKYPVIPAFYRDVDIHSSKKNEIDKLFYCKMLHLSNMIKHTDNFMFADDPEVPIVSDAHIKMANTIQEAYTFFMNKINGANGFVNKYVVGKANDYGARLVISTPSYNTEHFKDTEADFFHSSTPLAVAANIFAPFIVFGITQWIKNYISGGRYVVVYDFKAKKTVRIELDPTYMDEFTVDNIRRYLNLYKKNKRFRVQPVTLRSINKERIPIHVFHIGLAQSGLYTREIASYSLNPMNMNDETDETMAVHELTWCELFYMLSVQYLSNKCIYNTRYPLTAYVGTYVSQMNIIPANKYMPVEFDGVEYPRYPDLRYNSDSEIQHLFTDTMRMFSTYAPVMGADFDGDQISTAGVFTDEANDESIKEQHSLANIVGINGETIRELPPLVKHGIYGLTYKPAKVTK